MAPLVDDTTVNPVDLNQSKSTTNGDNRASQPASTREPLELTGALDAFKSFDVTPTIGREFQNVDIADWLRAPNSDEVLRDLAITSE